MLKYRSVLVAFVLAFFIQPAANATSAGSTADSWLDHVDVQGPVTLFTGPSPTAHSTFEHAIQSASKSVLMEMYHLTDTTISDALSDAARRGVLTTIILDGQSVQKSPYADLQKSMQSAGVQALASSSGFSITHTKSVVIDGTSAIISSMNLTDHPETRRDYGVVVNDPGVISEMETVFNADIENAKNQTALTPALSDPHLLWSPVNSASKLHDLITSARVSIVAVAENVFDDTVVKDLIAAAQRGVRVQVMSPACPMGQKPDRNFAAAQALKQGGVDVKQMQQPATPTTPYLHGKMMVIDGTKSYVGSINYSYNSLMRARELGIVLSRADISKALLKAFADDFDHALLTSALPVCADVAQ